jgi:hypothetical protein
MSSERAIDRAYLLEKHGEVWKHAHLKDIEYADAEFLAEWPRAGGIVLDATRAGREYLIDRINRAVRPIFNRSLQAGIEQHAGLSEQLRERRDYARGMAHRTQNFQNLLDDPNRDWADAYSDKSIVKEIAQLVGIVVPDRVAGSTIDIDLTGRRSYDTLRFDGQTGRRFIAVSSRRELGPAFILNCSIRVLDSGNKHAKPKAKILNLASNREVVLHLENAEDFDALHPFHTAENVHLYVAPLMEAGGFDVHGGDLYFLGAAE